MNPKDGGIGIENPGSIAKEQYEASRYKTQIHVLTIKKQSSLMENENEEGILAKEIEEKNRQEKNNRRRKRIEMQEIPETLKPLGRAGKG